VPPEWNGIGIQDIYTALVKNEQRTVETRFIEVKGRAAVGEIALTANEYKTAQRLSDD
jgi:hypothetical protein